MAGDLLFDSSFRWHSDTFDSDLRVGVGVCATRADHAGTAHERQPGTVNTTRCGLTIGPPNQPRCARACRVCVDENLREYALTHDCVTAWRVGVLHRAPIRRAAVLPEPCPPDRFPAQRDGTTPAAVTASCRAGRRCPPIGVPARFRVDDEGVSHVHRRAGTAVASTVRAGTNRWCPTVLGRAGKLATAGCGHPRRHVQHTGVTRPDRCGVQRSQPAHGWYGAPTCDDQ